MEDLANLQRTHRWGIWQNYVFFFAGIALLASPWGIRSWLIGLGLMIYATTWAGITSFGLELMERLEALNALLAAQEVKCLWRPHVPPPVRPRQALTPASLPTAPARSDAGQRPFPAPKKMNEKSDAGKHRESPDEYRERQDQKVLKLRKIADAYMVKNLGQVDPDLYLDVAILNRGGQGGFVYMVKNLGQVDADFFLKVLEDSDEQQRRLDAGETPQHEYQYHLFNLPRGPAPHYLVDGGTKSILIGWGRDNEDSSDYREATDEEVMEATRCALVELFEH
jgi:hypothetical protein